MYSKKNLCEDMFIRKVLIIHVLNLVFYVLCVRSQSVVTTTTETFYDAENETCSQCSSTTNIPVTRSTAATKPNATKNTLQVDGLNSTKPNDLNATLHRHLNISESDLLLKFATPCTTPNGDAGRCIEIQRCQILLDQLNNTRAATFLRQSLCGPDNEDKSMPKVCCGRYGNFRRAARNPLPKRCGLQNSSLIIGTRIFGGVEAELGEFPWMARIIHKNSFGYKTPGCSGFLIASRYILTAAHCVKSQLLEPLGPPFEVLLGEHNSETEIDCDGTGLCSERPQRIRVQEYIVHPRYDETARNHHNDIALIHLKKGATLSEFVFPICLLDHEEQDVYEYWISGWGKTEISESSTVKLKVSLPPVPLEQCHERYSVLRVNINKSQLCAGGVAGEDSCTGDSGGPLMVAKNATHWYAAGIVSFGLSCGKDGWPGVYTNIPNYLPWIKKEILARALPSAPTAH